jgi:dienelactone hydrolase
MPLAVALALALAARAQGQPPYYAERADLLYFLDAEGGKHAIATRCDWAVRAGHIRAGMELVMGALRVPSTAPLEVEVKSETRLHLYTRRHLSFSAGKGNRVPAYLLIPHHRPGKVPALVCLPGSSAPGKDNPAGLTARPSMAYAHELAERGYVCIIVDYPLLHAREYAVDPYQLGYASATMLGIVNHRRAVDLLEALPFVDPAAIGVIGHSLGGHNALFLAAFDARVKAVVSSCGFNVFAKHNDGNVTAWSQDCYMPRIKTIYHNDPKQIPFDFTEVLAALAPRAVFVNAPLHDRPDFEVSGVRDCIDAALPVYRQIFDAADRLVVEYPDAGHAFPLAQRLSAYHFLDRHLKPVSADPGLDRDLAAHWPQQGKPGDFAPRPFNPGAGDFSIALHLDGAEGDLASQFDPVKRRGWHLTLQTNRGITTSQPNTRQLQFGIDDNKVSEFIDLGRPGNAVLPFGFAVHEGRLYTGTCEPGEGDRGRVYLHAGGQRWLDCSVPAQSNSITALVVHQGKLHAAEGRYNTGGSALAPAKNQAPGGRVWRFDDGRWTDLGQLPDTDAVGGLVVFRGKLYASSLYKPAGLFRHEGGTLWSRLPTPEGKRVNTLTVFRDRLYATSYDGGHVYRWDGEQWTDLGRLEQNTQTYSFVVHDEHLLVGTWPSGKVYRLTGDDRWVDTGRLGEEREVMGMLVANSMLYAGTLPLAEVFRHDGDQRWTKVARLDTTPDVTYRRVWTMASHQGRLILGTLPAGKVFAFEPGRSATWDFELPPGKHHVVAVKERGVLKLYVDGRFAAMSSLFDPADYNLATDTPPRIGAGRTETFQGRLADVRIYRRALTEGEIAALAK